MKTTSLLAFVSVAITASLIDAAAQSASLNSLWSLAPGSRAYLANDNNQRGLAYNPVTGHVLLVNRTTSLSVNILDGATGADLGALNVTGISGGTYALNLVGIGTDGAIYAGNLVTDSSTSPFKLYRWANESATPQLVYSGDPSIGDATATNRRFGDSLDVRGSGNSTQVLISSRAGSIASVLTTTDGSTFNATKLNISGAAAGDVGLGLAFGSGNTFWGTANGRTLKFISYDLTAGTGLVVQDYGAAVVPTALCDIAVDPTRNVLAGLNLGTPDAFQLYDISGTPTLLDSKLTAKGDPDNANANATGALDFGSGMLFALDSNNGISAFTVVVPEPQTIAILALGLGLAGARCFGRRFRR
jgi:hypothetical protein